MYLIIDIGANTIRAVIFRFRAGKLVPVLNKKYSAGLANYIDEEECMTILGMKYLVGILKEIKMIIDISSLDGVYPFATASLRNAHNSNEVLEYVENEVGMKIDIVSGKEEAYYDYYAVMRTLDRDRQQGILTDIGGGSTEVVIFNESKPVLTESIPIGSLNMFNKYAKKIILSKHEREALYQDAFNRLKKENLNKGAKGIHREIDEICAVGGSCRSALKLFNLLNEKPNNNLEFETKFLHRIYKGKYSDRELISLILKTSPERIHTLVPGMMILKAVADYFEIEKIKINTHGVREGYLYYKLEQGGKINA